jgi:hypothetical protein
MKREKLTGTFLIPLARYTYCNLRTCQMSQNLILKFDVMQKYLEQAQDLVFNENALLQTLGFDVAIDHPHTHVVRCCHLVRGKCLAVTTAKGRYIQAGEVRLTRLLENLNYTADVVNIVLWNYAENVFLYFISTCSYCVWCQELLHFFKVHFNVAGIMRTTTGG